MFPSEQYIKSSSLTRLNQSFHGLFPSEQSIKIRVFMAKILYFAHYFMTQSTF
jgi:hypothetical protein